jgi:hypothetical protein
MAWKLIGNGRAGFGKGYQMHKIARAGSVAFHAIGPGEFMIAVILSTCLVTDPTICREHSIPLSSEVSAMQCLVTAMQHVAQWSEEQPYWRVVRWQCRATSQKGV